MFGPAQCTYDGLSTHCASCPSLELTAALTVHMISEAGLTCAACPAGSGPNQHRFGANTCRANTLSSQHLLNRHSGTAAPRGFLALKTAPFFLL